MLTLCHGLCGTGFGDIFLIEANLNVGNTKVMYSILNLKKNKKLLMRFLVFSLVTVLFTISIYSQTTNFNSAWSTGSSVQCGRLKSIEIRNDGVIATIEVKALKALKRLEIFSTSNTYILSGNTRLLQLSGLITDRGIVNCGYGTNWGWSNVPLGAIQSYQLFFKGTLPSG